MEYINGTKSTWRYWAWRQLKERVKVQPGLATILFLSGPSPEDLEAAKKNGFKVNNIVAVDIDPDAVKAARKSGCVAIEGDIHNIVSLWDDGVIHGVVADYCCGMSWEQFMKSYQMIRTVAGPSCLNFQRGRESSDLTSLMRDAFKKHAISKARSEQFIFLATVFHWHANEYVNKGFSARDLLKDVIDATSDDVEAINTWLEVLTPKLRPVFKSYRSNSVLMDSLVVDNYLPPLNARQMTRSVMQQRLGIVNDLKNIKCGLTVAMAEHGATQEAESSLKHMKQFVAKAVTETNKLEGIKQRLNAAKAVRTMCGAARMANN